MCVFLQAFIDNESVIPMVDNTNVQFHRRSTHGMHGRPDHHGKGRFSTQEAEGWRRRSHVADLPSVLSSSHFESSNVHRQDHNPTEATEKSGSYHQGKDDGESVLPHPDPSDSQVQVIYIYFFTFCCFYNSFFYQSASLFAIVF